MYFNKNFVKINENKVVCMWKFKKKVGKMVSRQKTKKKKKMKKKEKKKAGKIFRKKIFKNLFFRVLSMTKIPSTFGHF